MPADRAFGQSAMLAAIIGGAVGGPKIEPNFSISYETEREAKKAESAIRKSLAGAIDVSRG
jgi:hypothetical protein